MNRFQYRLLAAQMHLMMLWGYKQGECKMQDIKPGVKTSEFYMPTITALLGFLVSFGLLTTPLADQVGTAIAAAVPAVVGLIGAVQAAVNYIRGRVTLKNSVLLRKVD
jgi:hypothetical protein